MVKSPRSRRLSSHRSQSPGGYHPFHKPQWEAGMRPAQACCCAEVADPVWRTACGLPFITGKIEYGDSYFANGLVFDVSTGKKKQMQEHTKPPALMLADNNQVTTIKPGSLKKRLSNDFTAMHNFNDENCEPNKHMSYVTSPKKQKCTLLNC